MLIETTAFFSFGYKTVRWPMGTKEAFADVQYLGLHRFDNFYTKEQASQQL